MTEITGKTQIVVAAMSPIISNMIRSDLIYRNPSNMPLRRWSSSSLVPIFRAGIEMIAMISAMKEVALAKKAYAAPQLLTSKPAERRADQARAMKHRAVHGDGGARFARA